MAGSIATVSVRLHGLSHDRTNDLDLMLVGPQGQRIILMSDVGGANSVTDLTLSIDDAAPFPVPNTVLSSTTYRPRNENGGGRERGSDVFPVPAPTTGPLAITLGGFGGTDPIGTWALYVMDDSAGSGGSLSRGWELAITTLAPPTPTATRTATIPATATQTLAPAATVTSTATRSPTATAQNPGRRPGR
jgi:subtilisin-like proprotein convertase family protein